MDGDCRRNHSIGNHRNKQKINPTSKRTTQNSLKQYKTHCYKIVHTENVYENGSDTEKNRRTVTENVSSTKIKFTSYGFVNK